MRKTKDLRACLNSVSNMLDMKVNVMQNLYDSFKESVRLDPAYFENQLTTLKDVQTRFYSIVHAYGLDKELQK